MLRLRRYRVFLAFAIIAILAVYRFGSSNVSWKEQAASRFGQGQRGDEEQVKWEPKPQVAVETKKFQVEVPAAKNPQIKQTPPPVPPAGRPVNEKPPAGQGKKSIPAGIGHAGEHPVRPAATPTPRAELEQAVLGDSASSSDEAIHWSKTQERFPVPAESLIPLPTEKPKSIPRIQAEFKKETDSQKADRETKLDTIKEVFKRAWTGYKNNAWLHDEVRPVSGKQKDPFAGWGATLVDALDTLWIMGLKEEFEEAVKAVEKIDFTTTSRPDIPVFETTIRYLGGFLAAYDMAGMQHEILLTKAKELAEILMAAFDTPNRMPQTYYFWRPDFSSNPHPASNRVVLAEIGSLAMEFTYLAQLTGEDRYYDAIARITDNFEGYQNHTRLPGMWPTFFDASGCMKHPYDINGNSIQKPLTAGDEGWDAAFKSGASWKEDPNVGMVKPPEEGSAPAPGEKLSPEGHKYIPIVHPEPLKLIPNGKNPNWKPPPEEPMFWPGGPDDTGVKKRQLEESELSPEFEASLVKAPTCDNPGFGPSSDGGREEYTLGGMSDSTYEYLPKQWLLLGGQVEKYRTMYETSADVIKQNLIFRPMLPNDDDILFSGKLQVSAPTLNGFQLDNQLLPEYAHLTCFAGGMFGMGSKIFNRPKDLEIAARLTEGCVYSYNMTATGIMPEAFLGVACESQKDCHWNETLYYEILDPHADIRKTQYEQAMVMYEANLKSASSRYDEEMKEYLAAATPAPVETVGIAASEAEATGTVDAVLNKRQRPDLDDNDEPPTKVHLEVPAAKPSTTKTKPTFPAVYSPQAPLNHEEYVATRREEERLPLGVTRVSSKEYILRPEAIESVWYMYRITGDPYWRTTGWRMFTAINEATKTEHGNSAIDDVTKTSPEMLDSMESFWLAETLKYFYLLFSEEGVVSLDEWVLNTEAHPFRRPSA